MTASTGKYAKRRLSPLAGRFWPRLDKSGDCWEWTGHKIDSGYGRIVVDGRRELSHRVAFRLSGYSIPLGMCVCHHCDNPGCCNPNHLFLGTHADNMRDMAEKGRSRSGSAKLIQEDVPRIRDMIRCGVRQIDIAKVFCVERTAISSINRGKTWGYA